MIRITEVRIRLLDYKDSNLKAYANMTFDDCFVVHGIRVIQGEKGLFIAMPRRKKRDGTSEDIVHPVTREARALIEQRVLEAYRQAAQQTPAGGDARTPPSS